MSKHLNMIKHTHIHAVGLGIDSSTMDMHPIKSSLGVLP